MQSVLEVEKELNRTGISTNKRKLLVTLGFVSLEYVESLRSVAHLFGSRRNRCGIYLLWFADGFSYIGKAHDVVRRFGQHRALHSDIVAFSFQEVERNLLDERERTLIREAETGELRLRNVEHVSVIPGARDLDDVISPAEQEEWIKDPVGFNRADGSTPLRFPDSVEQSAMRRLREFENHPPFADCLSLLNTFLSRCLPAPVRTEYSFWSVSCCPSTNANTFPRLACVNLSMMEVFVLGYHLHEPTRVWGFINVSEEELLKHYIKRRNVKAHYPEIRLGERKYRSGGYDHCSLEADDLEPLRQLLSDQDVLSASAKLNLRLMRQRATIYSRYHNPALGRLIVSGHSKPAGDGRN